ncbi:hypothetical protein [Lysinibacillus yapensis]|nr:hypothetical protein [Lysinibacillus yapensis]
MDIVAAFIFYVIPALFIIWFMVNMVSAQRERNALLKELIAKIEKTGEE